MPKLKISSCTVQLLDGSEIIVEADKFHSSKELVDNVCSRMGIEEKEYFGLKYEHPKDGKISWFDVNKPLNKQLKKASNKFKVAVQFYPPSLQMLHEEITRYQFVLQTREYLLTGIWSCSIPTQALLASYIAQAEFGDYDSEKHRGDYLNELQFMKEQSDDFVNKVHLFHKKHKDLTPSDADWLYMETVRKIALYGMDIFDITDADSNHMKLGININGIHVLHMNTVLHSFLCPIVSKVYNNGKELVVVLNLKLKDEYESTSIGFMCSSVLEAKRIAKCCILYKDFSFHGRPKGVVKKGKQKKVEACSHLVSEIPSSDFQRVDSARFSKRLLKKSGDKEQNRKEEEPPEEMEQAKEGSSKNDVPVIVETWVQSCVVNGSNTDLVEKSMQDVPEVNGDVEQSKTPRIVVAPTDGEEKDISAKLFTEEGDGHAEVSIDIEVPVTDDQKLEEDVANDLKVDDSTGTGSNVDDLIADNVEHVVDTDVEIVVIDVDDVSLDDKNKSGTLLEEIEKELHESFEVLKSD